jgi:hypothetical protein
MVLAMKIDATSFPPARIASFSQIINVALPIALTGAGLIFLAMTLYAAFNIMTHGDNPDALKKAVAGITTAVIGLAIVILSFVAVKLLKILP